MSVSSAHPDIAKSRVKLRLSTLFIVVSKSGTTQETLTNEALALRWLQDGGVAHPKAHVVAVTSETSPMERVAVTAVR